MTQMNAPARRTVQPGPSAGGEADSQSASVTKKAARNDQSDLRPDVDQERSAPGVQQPAERGIHVTIIDAVGPASPGIDGGCRSHERLEFIGDFTQPIRPRRGELSPGLSGGRSPMGRETAPLVASHRDDTGESARPESSAKLRKTSAATAPMSSSETTSRPRLAALVAAMRLSWDSSMDPSLSASRSDPIENRTVFGSMAASAWSEWPPSRTILTRPPPVTSYALDVSDRLQFPTLGLY